LKAIKMGSEMKNKHIDDITMSLYLGGGLSLRKDLIEWLQAHLKECHLCAKALEQKIDMMAEQGNLQEPEAVNLESEVICKVKTLLSLPLKSSSSWDKLKDLCRQLINTLSEIDLPPKDIKKSRLSLVTTGYRYTKPDEDKDETSVTQERLDIGDNMLELLEILGDDKIPIPKRIALSEELLSYANKKSKELKKSVSPKKTKKKPEEKDIN